MRATAILTRVSFAALLLLWGHWTAADPIVLGDDDSLLVTFTSFAGGSFQYCGSVYTGVYVNSNGSLSFGAGDPDPSPSSAELLGGPPRIAGLWRDLDPSEAMATVDVTETAALLTVSFMQVPESGSTSIRNSFAIRIASSGAIEIEYNSVASDDALAGITAGDAFTSGTETEDDLSRYAAAGTPAGTGFDAALFELFTGSGSAEDFDLGGETLQFPACALTSSPAPPLANAGPDLELPARAPGLLLGAGTDPNAEALTYMWMQTSGPAIVLNPNAIAPQPTFTAPWLTVSDDAAFELTVDDGMPARGTGSDSAAIAIEPVPGSGVIDNPSFDSALTGWGAFPATQSGTLASLGGEQPTRGTALARIRNNAVAGAYLAQRFLLPANAAELSLDVNFLTNEPAASIADDRFVARVVYLDAGGDPVTQADFGAVSTTAAAFAPAGPEGYARKTGFSTVRIALPPSAQNNEAALILALQNRRDLLLESAVLIDNVQVGTAVNHAPTVSAGTDQSVLAGAMVTLGAVASDPEGTPLSLVWRQTAGPPVTLSSMSGANPSFTAPSPMTTAVLAFQVQASDSVLTAVDTVFVTVQVPTDAAPTANAGASQTVAEGSMVTLSGSGSDPDGDPLSFSWTQVEGPAVTLSSSTAAMPTFTAPTVGVNTVLRFDLTVSDGDQEDTDTTFVTVLNVFNDAPIANAGPDQIVREGRLVTLDGSGSSDPNLDPISFSWNQLGGPAVVLSSATAAMPTFTAPQVSGSALLTFRLTVSDGTLSSTDIVEISVVDNLPTVEIEVNQSAYSTGDLMDVRLSLDGPSSVVVDIYVGLLLPVPGFFTFNGFLGLQSAVPNQIVPLLTGFPLFPIPDFPFFDYTFTGIEWTGTYFWLAVLTPPGGDPLNPAQQLAFDFAEFTFSP